MNTSNTYKKGRKAFYKALLLLFVGLAFGTAKAQQMPHFTQYMFNDYITNPAIAGTHNYYQIRLMNRFQWVGIKDAPQTNSLSMYGPLVDKDMGVGGYIYMDQTGPTSRMGGYASYAYNVGITSSMRLSMGASLGFLQAKYDLSGINYGEDDIIQRGVYSDYVPDASFGIYVHDATWYAGFAAHQLIGNKLNLFDLGDAEDESLGLNKLKQHFYLTGGYIYVVNRDFMLEPLVIMKYVGPSPPQVDVAVKVNYRRMVWGAISYRSQDAISIMIGYDYDQKYKIGYAFDLSLTPIRKFNSGTHEIMLGVQFDKLK